MHYDRAATPGHSGSPVLNDRDEVVGMLFKVKSGIISSWLSRCKADNPVELFPFHWSMVGQPEADIVVGKGNGRDSMHRLKQPVPRFPALCVHYDQRFVYEAGQQVEELRRVDSSSRADTLPGFKGECSAEDREPVPNYALRLREQAVTPVHRGPQRLMAGQGCTTPAGQEPEPVGHRKREPRLAHATGTDQGHQARGQDQLGYFGDLLFPPDEARELDGKVVGAARERLLYYLSTLLLLVTCLMS